jgi:hypothetical protein
MHYTVRRLTAYQTAGKHVWRQQQRRGAGLLIAKPLFFQQLNLAQQSQQFLPLLGRARRYGTHQQRLAKGTPE